MGRGDGEKHGKRGNGDALGGIMRREGVRYRVWRGKAGKGEWKRRGGKKGREERCKERLSVVHSAKHSMWSPGRGEERAGPRGQSTGELVKGEAEGRWVQWEQRG